MISAGFRIPSVNSLVGRSRGATPDNEFVSPPAGPAAPPNKKTIARKATDQRQPARSMSLTASALFSPSADRLIVSALNSPNPLSVSLILTPGLTGYT